MSVQQVIMYKIELGDKMPALILRSHGPKSVDWAINGLAEKKVGLRRGKRAGSAPMYWSRAVYSEQCRNLTARHLIEILSEGVPIGGNGAWMLFWYTIVLDEAGMEWLATYVPDAADYYKKARYNSEMGQIENTVREYPSDPAGTQICPRCLAIFHESEIAQWKKHLEEYLAANAAKRLGGTV